MYLLSELTMDDIFSMVREGRAIEVRVWLDNTENDLNQGLAWVVGQIA